MIAIAVVRLSVPIAWCLSLFHLSPVRKIQWQDRWLGQPHVASLVEWMRKEDEREQEIVEQDCQIHNGVYSRK